MNTKQLSYVLTLAQQGSFSKAAEALGISQPSLSQYIKKIEKEIGLELFCRTNTNLRLTDAGRVYLDTGRKILSLEHQMEAEFSDLAASRSGSVIVGAAPYRAAGMMPMIARRYQELHPGMHLIVREGTTAELTEGMERGEYDLCLTLLPVDSNIFNWEPIMQEELILVVPGEHPPFPAVELPDRRWPAIDAQLLDGERMVMLTEHQFMQQQLMNTVRTYRIQVRPAVIVKSLQAQIEMVRQGVGAALMPSGIERFCTPSEVTLYSFVQPLPRRTVAVMWRKDSRLSKAMLELKDLMKSMPW
ncbi:MAG: LysR family transcriptional regulator [Clostridia bacterium]|nr:LysR family transcriptional regulator [Clostridia bacterium]